MAATIPNLWPDDIKVDLLPPVTILRAQANKIGEITQGILEGEVTTVTGEKDLVTHRLDLLAPSLDGRRVRVLSATHRDDFYPVVLEADCFLPKFVDLRNVRQAAQTAMAEQLSGLDLRTHASARPWPYPTDWRPVVSNQDEFLKRVAEVFRSMEVRSVIESMIALSNQKAEDAEQEAEAAPTA